MTQPAFDIGQFPIIRSAYDLSARDLARGIEDANRAMAAGVVTKSGAADISSRLAGAVSGAISYAVHREHSMQYLHQGAPSWLQDAYYTIFEWRSLNKLVRLYSVEPSHPTSIAAMPILAEASKLAEVAASVRDLAASSLAKRISDREGKAKNAVRSFEAFKRTPMAAEVIAAVEAEKPALEAIYIKEQRAEYEFLAERFGPFLKGAKPEVRAEFRPFLTDVAGVLNEAALTEAAKSYADGLANKMLSKLHKKAGALESPKVLKAGWISFSIQGELNGRKVRIEQQMILNRTVAGALFNQFPARIYLDGKAISEAAYMKLHGVA